MKQKQKKYIYTESYPFRSFITKYDTCGSCIVHGHDGLYEEIYYFSRNDETIIARCVDGWKSIEELKSYTNNFIIYHVDSGRYIISSNPQNFISQKEDPVILYSDYKYQLLPKSEALKSIHFHEDDFFNEVLRATNQIRKEYIETFSKKQIEELNSSFRCAICGKEFKNTQKDWMWCATPYGPNRETYQVLACPRCIEKAKGVDKYKYQTITFMTWGFCLLLIALCLYVTLALLELKLFSALLITAGITSVCGLFFHLEVENSLAERFLRFIGFQNFVDKNRAKSLSSLVDYSEMYFPESKVIEEKKEELKDLSYEVTSLMRDVCVSYNVSQQADYYYGDNLINDDTLPIEIKMQILQKSQRMFEDKKAPYTNAIRDYINLIAQNIKKVEAFDYSFITAEKPTLGYYIIIADMLIKELVTNYGTITTHTGVTDYIGGEPVLSKWYTSISTNLSPLNSHSLLHTIHYYVDKTIEIDPVLECSNAIFNVVNQYGDIEMVLDKNKMSEVVSQVLSKIKIKN